MKLSFPHMGNTEILLKDLFRRTGIEVVVPPPTSEKTLKLGVKCAPEFACLPLKATIGNFIEARKRGRTHWLWPEAWAPAALATTRRFKEGYFRIWATNLK